MSGAARQALNRSERAVEGLNWLPAILRVRQRPWLVVPVAYGLSIVGSLAIATLIGLIAADAQGPDFGWLKGSGFVAIFALAVASPLVETLILAGTTSILLRLVRPAYAILLSSAGWALAHSYQAPVWGLVIFWPFIIFTTLYIVWKQRSLAWGLFMPFAAHMLQNLLPAIAIGFPGLIPIA